MTDIVARTSEALTALLSRTLSPDEIALALHDAGLLAERDSHDDCVYQARLDAVEELHYPALMPKPRGGALKVCAHCARQMHAVEKRAVWPCDTIKAARGE